MSKHLADHRAAPTGQRVKEFVTIAHRGSGRVWQALWKRPVERAAENRRLVQYIRIEKGHEA